jgi:hypothetical protein
MTHETPATEGLWPAEGPVEASSKAKWWATALQMILGGVVGGVGATVGLKALPDMGVWLLVWLIPAIVLCSWLHIVLHEAGHAVAGVLAGLKPLAFGVGPLRLERSADGWRPRWGGNVKGIGGFALLLPRANTELSRGAQAAYLLGGPMANLLLAGLAFALLAFGGELNPYIKTTAVVFAGLGLLLGGINLLPFRSGGWMTDGAGLVALVRDPRNAMAMFRIQRVVQASMEGQRPRDWPASLLPRGVPDGAPSDIGIASAALSLSRALDEEDHAEADSQARWLASVWPKASEPHRPGLAISMACYALLRHRDAALVKAWRELGSGGILDMSCHQAWIDAGAAELEGRFEEARSLRASAEEALPRIHDAGTRVVVAEQLQAMAQRLTEVGVKDT